MENDLIKESEDEFYFEIREKDIHVNDILALGVSEFVIKEEIFLRKFYGDRFLEFTGRENELVDDSKKSISKVNLDEIEKISIVQELIDNLSRSEFNQNLGSVLAKIREEEE